MTGYLTAIVLNPALWPGSTAVAVMITPTHMICANAGDSRAAYLTGGKAVALSEDHKPTNPAERDRIEAAGGHVCVNAHHLVCEKAFAFQLIASSAFNHLGLGCMYRLSRNHV